MKRKVVKNFWISIPECQSKPLLFMPDPFNPDDVLGLVMKAEMARKSGSLESSTAMVKLNTATID
ncbi:MAG: hypothetical protein R6V72_01435 [Cyclobacterium sp.]|uniref:hypothetical protein n=1 Tax=Cyclobacterium sp. SYSU L10401 TaxID=2678657 RepID=UPI0013D2A2DC|nr:hypothetical protein [Cyclobacterium sp. SYSU L10401]